MRGGVQVVCPDELVIQAGPGGGGAMLYCGTSKLRGGYPERRGIQCGLAESSTGWRYERWAGAGACSRLRGLSMRRVPCRVLSSDTVLVCAGRGAWRPQ